MPVSSGLSIPGMSGCAVVKLEHGDHAIMEIFWTELVIVVIAGVLFFCDLTQESPGISQVMMGRMIPVQFREQDD
jgi:hypothetical protein